MSSRTACRASRLLWMSLMIAFTPGSPGWRRPPGLAPALGTGEGGIGRRCSATILRSVLPPRERVSRVGLSKGPTGAGPTPRKGAQTRPPARPRLSRPTPVWRVGPDDAGGTAGTAPPAAAGWEGQGCDVVRCGNNRAAISRDDRPGQNEREDSRFPRIVGPGGPRRLRARTGTVCLAWALGIGGGG